MVLALVAAGCGGISTPQPVIEEFSHDIVRVRVPYTARGPQSEAAHGSAEDMAQRYCQSHNREAAFASFFQERGGVLGGGAFYFVYRCAK